MIGTLLSILFSIFLMVYPGLASTVLPWHGIIPVIISLSFALFFIHYVVSSLALSSLQRGEKNVASHLMQIYHKDRGLNLAHLFIALFPLLTGFIALLGLLFPHINQMLLLAIWIVLFGISLDLIHHSYKKTASYLDPYAAIKQFTSAARRSIQDEKEGDLCDWIDALSEAALKAIEGSNLSLCNESLAEIQVITRNFLESQKSIGHPTTNDKEMGISDKVSFTLFYIFQRLEMINDKAIQCSLEPASTAVITNLGKIVSHAAKCDISLAVYPIYVLGKCAKKAQELKFPDIGSKATLVLLEVAKAIPAGMDVTYLELKDPYITLVNQLHEIANLTFKQDKSINIATLSEPFKMLANLFQDPKLASHRDTPVIVDAIKQVQAEFDALELVMKTIPPLPNLPEEEAPQPESPKEPPQP